MSDIDYGYLIENVSQDPWIVHVKGNVDGGSFEICVARTSNDMAKRSWGWFEQDKLLISHNGGPCDWPLAPGLGNFMIEVANRYCDMLNRGQMPKINSPFLQIP